MTGHNHKNYSPNNRKMFNPSKTCIHNEAKVTAKSWNMEMPFHCVNPYLPINQI